MLSTRGKKIRRIFLSLPFFVLVLPVASTTARAASSQQTTYCVSGQEFMLSFQYVGITPGAQHIAACDARHIYSLDASHRLWESVQGGASGSWVYLTTPLDASSMACIGEGSLIVMNYSKTLWFDTSNDVNPVFYGWESENQTLPDALVIGGGNNYITAINENQGLWISPSTAPFRFAEVGVAEDAARFTADDRSLYVLNYSGSMWQSLHLGNGSAPIWNYISPLAFTGFPSGNKFVDVADADGENIFLLDDVGNLWDATIVDTFVICPP